MANTGMDKPTDSPRTEENRDPLLTEKDTCAYLRVSKRNLYCWRMAGLVPYFKIGRAVRFRKAELDAALERWRTGWEGVRWCGLARIHGHWCVSGFCRSRTVMHAITAGFMESSWNSPILSRTWAGI